MNGDISCFLQSLDEFSTICKLLISVLINHVNLWSSRRYITKREMLLQGVTFTHSPPSSFTSSVCISHHHDGTKHHTEENGRQSRELAGKKRRPKRETVSVCYCVDMDFRVQAPSDITGVVYQKK